MAIKYQGSTVLTQLITLVKTALKGKSDTSHKHTKSQITDMPTRLSQFVNDSGFKTTDNNTTYTLTKSGNNITLRGSDGTSNTVVDANSTYDVATTTSKGLMSASDKKKVDGIASTTKTITIAASDWQDGYYTLFDPLITSATSNQDWMEPLATDSNKAMREMLCAANLKDVAQGVGWAKVRCEGTVPTSDVEVRICFRGEK